VVGPLFQGRNRGCEDLATCRVVFLGNLSDSGQYDARAQLVGHGEGTVGTADSVVELVGGVKGPPSRQVKGDQRELYGAEEMTQLAPARLTEALRR
jgi:hypothetical protein